MKRIGTVLLIVFLCVGILLAQQPVVNNALTDAWDAVNHWIRVSAVQSGTWTVTTTNSDPCANNAKTFQTISVTANTQVITGVSAKKVYVCSMQLGVAAADNVAIVEGTGTVCATGVTGMFGGATAATGWNLAANGGLTQGDGRGSIGQTATTADNVCILVSAAVQASGSIGYVIQ